MSYYRAASEASSVALRRRFGLSRPPSAGAVSPFPSVPFRLIPRPPRPRLRFFGAPPSSSEPSLSPPSGLYARASVLSFLLRRGCNLRLVVLADAVPLPLVAGAWDGPASGSSVLGSASDTGCGSKCSPFTRFCGRRSSSSSSSSLRSLPEKDPLVATLPRSDSLPARLAEPPEVDTDACEGGGMARGACSCKTSFVLPAALLDSVRALMDSR